MNNETYTTATVVPLDLKLVRDDIDGKPHFQVTLTGDAGSKILYDGYDEKRAEAVYLNERMHYEAQALEEAE